MPRLLAACLAGAITLAAAAQAAAQGCAMCGSGFGQDDPLGRAISWSVLFLMSVPYAIAATVAGWLYLVHRRAPRSRAAVIDLGRLRAGAPEGDPS